RIAVESERVRRVVLRVDLNEADRERPASGHVPVRAEPPLDLAEGERLRERVRARVRGRPAPGHATNGRGDRTRVERLGVERVRTEGEALLPRAGAAAAGHHDDPGIAGE